MRLAGRFAALAFWATVALAAAASWLQGQVSGAATIQSQSHMLTAFMLVALLLATGLLVGSATERSRLLLLAAWVGAVAVSALGYFELELARAETTPSVRIAPPVLAIVIAGYVVGLGAVLLPRRRRPTI